MRHTVARLLATTGTTLACLGGLSTVGATAAQACSDYDHHTFQSNAWNTPTYYKQPGTGCNDINITVYDTTAYIQTWSYFNNGWHSAGNTCYVYADCVTWGGFGAGYYFHDYDPYQVYENNAYLYW